MPQLTLTLSARVDGWRNYDGHNLETSRRSARRRSNNVPSLPDRDDTVVSPRAAALYHVTDRVDVWGDIGWGFRAPTLNELYRQFRVGTTLTLANNALGPERLVGGEAGVTVAAVAEPDGARDVVRQPRDGSGLERDHQPGRRRTSRSSGRTSGKTRIWGIQTDVEYRIGAVLESVGAPTCTTRRRSPRTRRTPRSSASGCRRCPRIAARSRVAYSNPKLAHACRRRAVRRLAVRRRPEPRRRGGCRNMRVVELTASRALRPQPRAVRRRPEHVRRRVLRRHAADDRRLPAPGDRRTEAPAALKRPREDRGSPNACILEHLRLSMRIGHGHHA